MIDFQWDENKDKINRSYRESETVIRIISARKATKKEKERYVRGL